MTLDDDDKNAILDNLSGEIIDAVRECVDERGEVSPSIAGLLTGIVQTEMEESVLCDWCGGSGGGRDELQCPHCNGTGEA